MKRIEVIRISLWANYSERWKYIFLFVRMMVIEFIKNPIFQGVERWDFLIFESD